jgi:hypothetical protein
MFRLYSVALQHLMVHRQVTETQRLVHRLVHPSQQLLKQREHLCQMQRGQHHLLQMTGFTYRNDQPLDSVKLLVT